jgi:hypothetical protein
VDWKALLLPTSITFRSKLKPDFCPCSTGCNNHHQLTTREKFFVVVVHVVSFIHLNKHDEKKIFF